MKHKLGIVLATAAALVAASASNAVYATAINSNSISIANGLFVIDEYANEYVVHNNSTEWYIYAFAISNPNGLTDNPQTNYAGPGSTGLTWLAASTSLSLGEGQNIEPVNAYYSQYLDTSGGFSNPPLSSGYVLTDFIAPGETTAEGNFTFGSFAASDVGLLVVNSDGGLEEFGSAATPLPSTWSMMIAALFGLGYFAYRGARKGSALLAA